MTVKQMEKTILDSVENTHHFNNDRKYRQSVIEELFKVEGKILYGSYRVNNGHRNGEEIHNVYENGIIEVFNYNSKKHVTSMIARKNQLLKYSDNFPKSMLDKAIEHQAKGLNNI